MDRNKSIILQAKRIGIVGKHAGSKPIKKLLNLISQNDSRWYWHFKGQEARNKS